jgi:tetratricopeptide (TPR) repeat protein
MDFAPYLLPKPAAKPRKNGAAEESQVLLAFARREYDAGRMAGAERLCLQILTRDVRHADALFLLGMTGFKTARYEMAERMMRRAIDLNGRQAPHHFHLGNALQAQGKLDEAAACFERALGIQPEHAEACYNLGNTLLARHQLDKATALYRRALAVKPRYSEAWCNLGAVNRQQGKLDEAVNCFERALSLAPNNANFCCNLGDALHAQGKVEEAVVWYRRALALDPAHYKAANCLCNALFDLGDLAGAVAWSERALAIKPGYGDALMNRCLLQLLKGDYIAGWRNHEVRWQVYPPRLFSQPLWTGAPLKEATILLYAEQGLGDSLQFLRYVPLVQAAGGRVVLELPANLRRLAAGLPGLAALVNFGPPLPRFDCRCPLMSLPLAFGTTVETIPARVPYLAVPEEALRKASALAWPTTGLRVGLAWTGNPSHPKNRSRSIPLGLLEPLFNLDNVQFFSLQMGSAAAELATRRTKITDLAPVTGDMADTAAQMAHLDLVVSIDTSIAHLAGALTRPLWVLLSYLPDWRWLLDREDSPWYPTARLFRQPKPGDWLAVIERVRAALVELAAQKQAAQQ